MVLVKNHYKTDREIEEELQQEVIAIRQPCVANIENGDKPEILYPNVDLTNKLIDRMVQQDQKIRYLLKLIQELQELRNIELDCEPNVVVIEEISKEKAKCMIEGYFIENGSADIEELMIKLQIPVQTIISILDELREEGKLTPEGE